MTSRGSIPLSFQRRVRLRAGNRCEYCGMPQAGQEATFHVDHVVPRRDGGPTTLDNLALACVSCSLRKGARTEARDPHSGEPAAMFNPRAYRWEDHFELAANHSICGKTPTGRASVELLQMNRPAAIEIRRRLGQREG
ncbi:MAG: HNH endonuclease signature motif containing protein [Minicystis sp.]